MNEYKKNHAEKKQKVTDCLSRAESFLLENGFTEEAGVAHQQSENLRKGEFSIAIVGEFSAGKSTFLNALMGEKLLPSFSTETTATINFLRHKEKAQNGEEGCVYYNDGRQLQLEKADAETISRYVSTNSEEKVAQNISKLDLYLDSRFLEGNVTLVDTPGLNGVAEGHREITQEQIEKSSAGIFMFNANQPGSKTDFKFLTELRKHVKNVILVLNQIDCIKKSEGETVESVIASLKENYKKNVEDVTTVPEIMPVAAYLSLIARSSANLDYHGKMNFTNEEKAAFEQQSRMQDFENRLWRFLTQGEKAKQELLAPLDQLNAQLGKIKARLGNELEVLSGAVDQDELAQKLVDLSNLLVELESQLSEKTSVMKEEVRNAERDFNESIEGESERLKQKYANKVDNFADLDDIDPDSIQKRLKHELKEIVNGAYGLFVETLRDIMSVQANSISGEINDALDSGLDISIDRKLELPEFSVGIEEYQQQEKCLLDEIDKLRQEAEKSFDDYELQLQLQSKRDCLERQLEQRREAREVYEQNSMALAPPARVSQEQVREGHWRDGILGFIGTLIIGKKYETKIVDVVDTKERDAFLQQRKAILDQRSQEIQSYESKLAECADVNPAEAERIAQRKQRALEAREKEIEKLQQEFNEKVRHQSAAQFRKQKVEIGNYVDEMVDDIKKETRNKFRKQRDALLNVMTELVAGSVRKQIELKQQEIQLLQSKNETAVSERDERIVCINNQLAGIKSILEESLAVKEEIDSIATDIIAEEIV